VTLSIVLSLFLLHLGIGVAFTLALVSRAAGVKFFRFIAGLAAILIAAGYAFREPAAGEWTVMRGVGLASLAVCETALIA
jgi:hypothetical protein